MSLILGAYLLVHKRYTLGDSRYVDVVKQSWGSPFIRLKNRYSQVVVKICLIILLRIVNPSRQATTCVVCSSQLLIFIGIANRLEPDKASRL